MSVFIISMGVLVVSVNTRGYKIFSVCFSLFAIFIASYEIFHMFCSNPPIVYGSFMRFCCCSVVSYLSVNVVLTVMYLIYYNRYFLLFMANWKVSIILYCEASIISFGTI